MNFDTQTYFFNRISQSKGLSIGIVLVMMTLAAALSCFSQDTPTRIIHVFTALCDNKYQGIVPVPESLGNGDDPANNLYWGAMYGIKTFFKRSANWDLIKSCQSDSPVLERCIFKHHRENVYLVADAYRGKEIRQAIVDFLGAAAGQSSAKINVETDNQESHLPINGNAQLIVYVGHDGLMDFSLDVYPVKQNPGNRDAMILACLSKTFFRDAITKAGAKPLLWTTGLMAPEAYTLENAFEGWVLHESDSSIRLRAALAYSHYQKCGLEAAKRLLVTGM